MELETYQILYNLFPKIGEKGTLLNSFCVASITLMPKVDSTEKEKLYINTSNELKYKNPQQNSNKLNLIVYKMNYTLWPNEIYS